MENLMDQAHAQFKQAKREYIEPNMEKAIDRALAEFKEVARRCNEPTTSEKPVAQLQHEHAEYEAKRLAYNALIEAIQYAEAEAADRARDKAHEKFYLDREAKIEARRLADLRKWQDEELAWRRQNWGFEA